MAYQVKYSAFGKHFDEVWIGGTKSQIEKTIIDICVTAQIESLTPVNINEDELQETHKEIDMEGCPMDIYRPIPE